jgi:hypothetical protein
VLQFKPDLSSPNWIPTTNPVPASGKGFFRIVRP